MNIISNVIVQLVRSLVPLAAIFAMISGSIWPGLKIYRFDSFYPTPQSPVLGMPSIFPESGLAEMSNKDILPTAALASAQYSITDLGFIIPSGLNNQGQVVGALFQGMSGPGLWDNGTLIPLGSQGPGGGAAFDINENGQVVGMVENVAFVWSDTNHNGQSDPGEMILLGMLGGDQSSATAINDAGEVVGWAYTSLGVMHAFRWLGGAMVDIHPGNDEDSSQATDINNAGIIVGSESLPNSNYWRALKWGPGGASPTPLGTLGDENGAQAINDLSQISGYYSYATSSLTRFLWLPVQAYGLPAGMNNLGLAANSDMHTINNSGQIIGSGGGIQPYLWQSGTFTFLSDLLPPGSGWTLSNASAINDKGQIVGIGIYQGKPHGFMLTPVPWTFLFYLAGDNNLSNSYPPIFQHLEAAANTPGIKILVLWDDIANGNSAYYEVKYDSDLTKYATYTEGDNYWLLGEVNSGEGLTLSEFITWGMQRSPSTYYALILDDHGSGLGGLAWDDSSNKDFITLPELKQALQTVFDQTQRTIDVLYMAMCLMGMLEDAYQVRGLVDYYVASEQLQTTYQNYLKGFSADMTPAQAAVTLAMAYTDEMTSKSYAYTISAADLSALNSLADSVNQLGQELATPLGTISGTITTIGTLVQRFDNKAPNGSITSSDTYVDLYDFADLVEQNLGGEAAIVAASQAVKNAVNTYLIYESHANNATYSLDHSFGVSIFFPATASSFYNPSSYDFAVGADWGNGQAALLGPSVNVTWGGFLVDYFQSTQPGGPDDPTPPFPLPKIQNLIRVYLPFVKH